MAAWPTLPEVRKFLRLAVDPDSDALLGTALAAAIGYGIDHLGKDATTGLPIYPGDTTTLPDPCHEACMFHAGRLYRRRDSIDGTIGWGDTGVIRVGRFDADIDALYSGYAPLVFG
jgi:hypothetical protein